MLLLSSLAKKFIVMRSQLSIKKGKKRKKKKGISRINWTVFGAK